MGGFGPEGLPEPNFGFKVSGNRDETLNLDCTLENLEQFPAVRALLPDCFEGPYRYQELLRLMEAVGIDDVPALRGCTAPLIADDMRYLPNPGGNRSASMTMWTCASSSRICMPSSSFSAR